MAKVGLVTQYYDPEVGSAAVPGNIARALKKRGFQVAVLTGYPNYPGGKFFPGTRINAHTLEWQNDIAVHRVPLIPSHSSGALRRASYYLSFALTSSVGLYFLRDCDVLLVHSTPAFAGTGPGLLARLTGKPLITMVMDLWPETLLQSSLTPDVVQAKVVATALEHTCNFIYRSSDAVTVASPSMRPALVRRGIHERRIKYVPNWIPNSSINSKTTDSTQRRSGRQVSGRTRLIYAGNLGAAQNSMSLVQAMDMIRERANVEMTIVGTGVLHDEMKHYARRADLANVNFLGPRSPEQVSELVAESDVNVITMASNAISAMTTPSKLPFSLSTGKPLVAALDGDAKAIAEESGGALICRPGNVDELAQTFIEVAALTDAELDIMGNSAFAFFQREFSETSCASQLVEVISQVLSKHETEKRFGHE